MIKGILIINNHGKVRLARFYAAISQQRQQQIIKDVFAIVSKRSDVVCNFVETKTQWQDKLIQAHTKKQNTEKKKLA